MVVQHNLTAMNANRYFGINNSSLSKSLEKLSSGFAINRAGDNAAGLAVSEKMRAQISGLTQASKNAEDGISMVQTYEGALTETDSILQRMRSLAVQSANGSYDNSVDRVAIEQEFKQLNDELNQIADTDFNGVIVLNGGEMADGLKAVDGTFDYSTITRDPKQLSAADVNKLDYQLFDDDNTANGRTNADTVWNTLNSTWNRKDTLTNNDGPESIDVTLKYDKEKNQWSVDSATGGADKTKITVAADPANGGVSLKAGNITFANVVFDETDLVNGDTMTLTLNNPVAGIKAATNAGAEVASNTIQGTTKTVEDLNLTTTLNTTNVTDAKMTETINNILNALDGATVEATYAKGTATVATDMKLTLSDGTEIAAGQAGAAYTLKDGTSVWVAGDTAGEITVSTVKADGTVGDEIMKFEMTDGADTDDISGKVTYKIGVEYNEYDASKTPTVEVKEPADAGVSVSNSLNQSTTKLTYSDHIALQVGARTKDLVDFTFAYDSEGIGELEADLNCTAKGLGTSELSLATQESANAAIDKIDNAINKVSMVRGTFGAIQNRLEHKISNLDTTNENLTAAESRIRDTDMAAEMMEFTKNQILSQASQSMLAQANQLPQGVLSLLQ